MKMNNVIVMIVLIAIWIFLGSKELKNCENLINGQFTMTPKFFLIITVGFIVICLYSIFSSLGCF